MYCIYRCGVGFPNLRSFLVEKPLFEAIGFAGVCRQGTEYLHQQAVGVYGAGKET